MKDEDAASRGPPCGDSLAATFMEFRSHLSRLVASIVGPHSTEDIVQETFVRSYEASRKQTINHPRSFLWRTAKNLALNHVHSAHQKLTTTVADFVDTDVYSPSGGVELDVELESKERFTLFREAVEALPPQCRRAFVLKKVDGLSQKEIAAHLGISESTVEKQVAKGLLMCARFMDAKGYPVDSSARERRSPRPGEPTAAARQPAESKR